MFISNFLYVPSVLNSPRVNSFLDIVMLIKMFLFLASTVKTLRFSTLVNAKRYASEVSFLTQSVDETLCFVGFCLSLYNNTN